MSTIQWSDWSSDPLKISGRQHSSKSQTIQLSNIAWTDENETDKEKKSTKLSGNSSLCIGLIIGALLCAIILAIVLTLWLKSTPSKKTTSLTNTTIVVNTTTITTVTITTTTTTTLTTSATSVTTSITTTVDPCTILNWNTTGTIVAGRTIPGNGADELRNPHGIYIDSNDILYICDYSNNRIQKWVLGATSGSTIAGNTNGNGGFGSNEFRDPVDLVFDKYGSMYVVDEENDRIQRYAPNSTTGVTVAGIGGRGNSNDQLKNPSGMAIDENLNLYIADTGNDRVMKWAANAVTGMVFLTTPSNNQPYGILLKNDSLEQVYLSECSRNRVGLWSAGTTQPNITLAGVNSNDLNSPTAIRFDPYGNLYVANKGDGDVRRFCVGSTTPSTIVSRLGAASGLNSPTGIAFDSNFNLYVADTGKNYVLKFSRL